MVKKTLEVNPVGAMVRKWESNFIDGNVQTSKYVVESPYDDINKILAYLSSKHTSGEFDALGREKPFYNICVAARNIWQRSTDLDRKDVKIKADTASQVVPAFVATLWLQDWMKRNNFGQFLNNWGQVLAGFNSAVVKFVEVDGDLHSLVVPWDKIIFDPVDFDNNPKIEILEMTPAQLRQKKGYDQEMVEKLIETTQARKNIDRTNKDTKADYIRLYEVHGNMELSYLTGNDKDDDTFVQQMHVISFVAGKNDGEYDDFTLISGREEKDPYMLTSLMPAVDGSVSFDGAVKNLFQTQWMVNHSIKQIKDQLDIASMLLFQTSDGNYVGQNAIQSLISGDILIHAPNQPLTQLANNSHDITSLQNYAAQWKALGQEITSTPDVTMGKNFPSGTAYRQAAIVQQESNSNFQMMTENKGLYLEKILRTYVIPFLMKKTKNRKQIVAELNSNNITKIDSIYIPKEAIKRTNNQVIDALINRQTITPEMTAQMLADNTQQIKSELGEERFLTPSEIEQVTWDDIFKDLEWECEINITGESNDKQAVLTTLSEVFQTIVKMGGRPMTPEEKFVFNKILSESNGVISPIEMSTLSKAATPAAQPAQAPMVGGVEGAALQTNMQQ